MNETETKAKRTSSLKGRPKTAEHKAKIAEGQRRRWAKRKAEQAEKVAEKAE